MPNPQGYSKTLTPQDLATKRAMDAESGFELDLQSTRNGAIVRPSGVQ
jgi:hypothetical protein